MLKSLDCVSSRRKYRAGILGFSQLFFVTAVTTLLAVTVTFGLVYPVIGLLFCAQLYVLTISVEVKIGMFLQHPDATIATVVEQCDLVFRSLTDAIWLLTPLSACFFGLFLMDTLGDAVGITTAWGALVAVMAVPILHWIAIASRRYLASRCKRSADNSSSAAEHSSSEEIRQLSLQQPYWLR